MLEPDAPDKLSRNSYIAISAGIAAVVVFPLLALGRVLGLWEAPLILIGLAFLITIVGMLSAFVMGLRGALKRNGLPWNNINVRGSWAAVALGVTVAVPVGSFLHLGVTSPPIHDISTDTVDPLRFVSLLAEREATNAPNSVEYNPEVAKQQKAGYPELGPLDLPLPMDQAFRRALDAVDEMDWRLAAAVPKEGRIEAVDVTFWSGFVDDVVIRLTPVSESETRIDVRSLSRVGRGDLGKNAARIQEYLGHLTNYPDG